MNYQKVFMKEGTIKYEEWLEWREEYYKMDKHQNFGVGVVGNLKPKTKRHLSEKKLKEGTVNKSLRTTKVEYLRYHTKTVGVINERGEYEIKLTKHCGEGDMVWVLENDGTFTKTKIY